MADALEIEQTAMIDREMDQVFDWAKDNHMPIRDAIWDHEMEANGHATPWRLKKLLNGSLKLAMMKLRITAKRTWRSN